MNTSVFRHPAKGVYRYSMGQRNLAREQAEARSFDGNEHFGQYLYSRAVAQVPMQTGRRYNLSPNQNALARLRYQAVDEELAGQFDYYTAGGAHDDLVDLIVDHPVTVSLLGRKTLVRLALRMRGFRTHKFADLCKTHVFAVEVTEGGARLVGYASEFHSEAAVAIPLEVLPD